MKFAIKPWTSPTGGSVAFTGLNPATEYKVVTKLKTNAEPAQPNGVAASGATSVVTAPSTVSVTRQRDGNTDKITFTTINSNDYMVIEKPSGAVVQNWTQGTGSDKTITGLDTTKVYEVLVRANNADGKYFTSSTEVPVIGVIPNAQTAAEQPYRARQRRLIILL